MDIPEQEGKVAGYRQEAERLRGEAAFEKKLSGEARQALEAHRARFDRIKQDYDDLERRKQQILREAGYDPSGS